MKQFFEFPLISVFQRGPWASFECTRKANDSKATEPAGEGPMPFLAMYRLTHLVICFVSDVSDVSLVDPCSGRMCLHRWTMQSSWICHTQKAGAKKAFFFHFFPGSGFLSKTFLEQQRYVPRKTLPALGRMSPQSATFRHSEYGSIAEFGFVALDFWKILESSLVLDRFHKFLWN